MPIIAYFKKYNSAFTDPLEGKLTVNRNHSSFPSLPLCNQSKNQYRTYKSLGKPSQLSS